MGDERRLKVLSLSTVYPNPREPGLGLFVRSRLQHMAAAADVTVIAPVPLIDYSKAGRRLARTPVPRERRDEALEVRHPRWLYPPMGGFINGLALFVRLAWPVWRWYRRVDVIDAHFAHPEGVAAALLSMVTGRPFTVTLRGNETMHAAHYWRGKVMRWALRRATRVIAVSERLRVFAEDAGTNREKTATIPNGIDTKVFYPRERASLRARFGMRDEVTAIVSAGYLIERKGHHRVIKAVGGLRRKGLPVELWVVGGPGREGEYEREIHREVERQQADNAVHFTGHVTPDMLAEYMTAGDVFCLASSREGWPNVVNEAQACGAPVVAFDVGGIPEMLPTEEYGVVVPPEDDIALEAALESAVRRKWDRERIAAKARERSWDVVASEVVEQLRLAAAVRRTE